MKNQIMAMIGCVAVVAFGFTAGARTFDFKQLKSTGSKGSAEYWWEGTEKSKSSWFQIKVGSASKIDDTSTMEIRAATVLKSVKDRKSGINDVATFEFDPINKGPAIFFMVASGAAFSREHDSYWYGNVNTGWQLAGCIIELWQKGKVVKHWSNVTGNDGKTKLTDDIKTLRINRDGRPCAGDRFYESRSFDNATEIYSVDKDGERVDIDIVLKPFREAESGAETASKDDDAVAAAATVKNTVAKKLQSCDFLLNGKVKKNAKVYLCLFSASWCPPCRREMPRIAKTYAKVLKDDPDIELIHFSRDQDDEKAMAWAKEHDVKFPVVKPRGGNPLDLHTRGIPHLFIVKADGTLIEEGHPMRIFNEGKFREIKGGGSIDTPKPSVCKVNVTGDEGSRAIGCSVVAQKLQDCDFLLNKVFKKNAKYYLCLFSASWCGPCRAEMPRIAKTYAETLKDDPDIELIHFSRDQNDEKAMAWAKEHDVKFPVVKPMGGNPLNLHCNGIPHLFIVKADGALVEEGHPMRIFNEEKFREIKSGNMKPRTVDDDLKNGERTEQVDGYTWTYRLENGGAIIVAAGGKRRCTISPSPKGSIAIPSKLGGVSVVKIGSEAFCECAGMTSVTFPASVKEICWRAFSDCRSLSSVSIPSGVTKIYPAAFSDCRSLTAITVSDENTQYASRDGILFDKGMKKLLCYPGGIPGAYVIPSGVTEIGGNAFSGCGRLTSVTVPDSVTRIGEFAFSKSRGLTSVSLGSGVTMLGQAPFYWCSGLTSIIVSEANGRYASRDGVLFDKDMKTVVCCPGGFSGEYVIPSSVTSVGRYAFDSCRKLTAVTIPSSVTRIDYHGFNYCDGLTSVVIPSGVRSIGDYAFDCRGLKTVMISDGVESIGSGAFSACFELSSVKIPSSVKNIGKYAFSSCKKVTSVVMCGERPELGEKAFNNCDSLKAIHVPANAKSWAGMREWQGIPLVFDAEAK